MTSCPREKQKRDSHAAEVDLDEYYDTGSRACRAAERLCPVLWTWRTFFNTEKSQWHTTWNQASSSEISENYNRFFFPSWYP